MYLKFIMSRSFPIRALGTTPKRLTTVGLTPIGRLSIAPALSISAIAARTKSVSSNADSEFFWALGAGAALAQNNL